MMVQIVSYYRVKCGATIILNSGKLLRTGKTGHGQGANDISGDYVYVIVLQNLRVVRMGEIMLIYHMMEQMRYIFLVDLQFLED